MDSNKILLIIIILVIIIICIIGLLIVTNKEMKNDVNIIKMEDEGIIDLEEDYMLTEVSSKNNFYIVKTIVKNYYLYLTKFNIQNDEYSEEMGTYKTEEELQETRENYKNIVYSLLSDEYIQENSITISNIEEKLGSYYDAVVLIEDMYYIEIASNITEYFVNGYVVEKNNLEKTDYSMLIIVDGANRTFEIYPTYEFKGKNIEELLLNISEVEDKENNKYTYRAINDDIIVQEIFRDYIYKINYDIEGAYNSLLSEYSKSKFDTIDEFKQFIENNQINEAILNEYSVVNEADYDRYICVDKNSRYYIFYVTSLTECTVILDTYTIDIPEFLKKYETATDENKAILNVNKINAALADKDYKYIYSKLNSVFKESNFKSVSEMVTYLENNLFEKSSFEYQSIEEQSDIYVVTVKVTNEENTNETKKIKVVIALGKNTDFEMSFSI